MNSLLGRLIDQSHIVRMLCIRGLGNVSELGSDQVRHHHSRRHVDQCTQRGRGGGGGSVCWGSPGVQWAVYVGSLLECNGHVTAEFSKPLPTEHL